MYDLKIKKMQVNNMTQATFSHVNELVNKITIRSIMAGLPIKPGDVKEQSMILRNQPVIIVSKSGALEVRASGTALNDATKGQLIRVRNQDSKRIVNATVTGPNRVLVMP